MAPERSGAIVFRLVLEPPQPFYGSNRQKTNMRGRNKLAVAATAMIMLASAAAAADRRGPILTEILDKLQSSLEDYDKGLPDFFCDEHAVSEVFPGTRRDITTSDSVFRLKRVEARDHATSFIESREPKTVNRGSSGAPSADAPAAIDGIFEGALAVVTSSQQECMDYQLGKPKNDAIIIDFKTLDHPQRPTDCLLQEKAHGRAYIDPTTLHIKRLEMAAPQHVIHDDRYRWAAPLKGEWVIAVDYAPVVLDGRSFWMPSAINSRVTSDPNTFHSRTWIFKASYSNFHKLEVTSRILPPR